MTPPTDPATAKATAAKLLLGPGPSPVEPRVMRAMAAPVLSHLDPEMMAILDDIRARLAVAFKAAEGSLALAISGTGTSGMEAAVGTLTRPGTRAVVDAVTSLGAHPVDAGAWGADVVYSCTQKGLGAPSGLAPIVFSKRARDFRLPASAKASAGKQAEGPVSFYFDLKLLEDYWLNRK